MDQLYNFFRNKTTFEMDRQKLELFTVTLPEDSIIYDIYDWLQGTNMTLPVVSAALGMVGVYGVFYGVYKHVQYGNMVYHFDRERLLTQYIINKSDSGSDYAPSGSEDNASEDNASEDNASEDNASEDNASEDNASEDNASEDICASSDEPEDLMDPRTATKKTVQEFESDLLSFERKLRKKKFD